MEKGQNVFIIAYTVAKWTDEQFRNRNSLICIKYTVKNYSICTTRLRFPTNFWRDSRLRRWAESSILSMCSGERPGTEETNNN